MKTKKAGFNSVDEYIAAFPEDVQKILKELRAMMKTTAPQAGEKISYGIPTFTLEGKYLIFFAGWKNHISIYPIPTGSTAFNKEISQYAEGKGTLKFPIDKPLSLKLIAKIVKLRSAEIRKWTDQKNYQAA